MKFDWKWYCTNYNDLWLAGIRNEQSCINHWNRYGKNEGRVYNKLMLESNIYKEFTRLLSEIKKYDCPCKKSLNNEVFNKLWAFLHNLSTKYELTNKEDLVKIMYELKNIKCEECKRHYIEYYTKKKTTDCLSCREAVILYFFELHNEINKRNNKSVMTRDEFNKLY
tara:strand:- start:47 stop:547 length:501 start_codon:yes stop_codon:yes gene_type:complete